MVFAALEQYLKENKIEYLKDEPMSRHTSFHIGGNADLFVYPHTAHILRDVIKTCKENEIPYFIIGKGSNLVISDKGIAGAVICTSKINTVLLDENGRIFAGAGATLAQVCTFAKNSGLSGLEFAYGIPGSVGGAMVMNAGAYGGEMKDVAFSAFILNQQGETEEISREKMELSYRNSIFKKKNYTVVGAVFELEKDSEEEIGAKMDDYINRRKTKQPLEYPSGGSVFKRPEGYFAGALIEENGFKGVSVGGAQVSEKHAGFIVNKGGATCNDVKELIKMIQDKVFENNGVSLETELIFKGRE